jgi:type I restriction enzyme S subunit
MATSGQLSCAQKGDGNVKKIISTLPKPSTKRAKLLAQQFDYDDLFNIPKHWEWIKLGELSSYGDTPIKVNAGEMSDDTWILELEDIQSGGRLLEKKRILNRKSIGEKIVFHSGQVLYSKLRPYLKKVLIADDDGIATPELIAFDVFGGISAKYITYCMTNSYVDKVINKRSYGIKMPRVDVGFMVNLLIPIPPLQEQIRIVNLVECAMKEIEKISDYQVAYFENIEVLKSKLIDAGIQGKLTEQLSKDGDVELLYEKLKKEKKTILKNRKGREDKNIKEVDNDVPYELPSYWKWVRLGEIGLFKKGPFGSALTKAMFVPKSETAVKVYEQQHAIQKDASLGTYYISREYFDEKMSGFEVESGDIIVSCAGTIGETYILPESIEQGIINQALMRVVLVDSVDKKFFQYYFDANLKKIAQNESNGSAIKNIPPFDVMKNWYFPLTSLEEQRRIVEKLNQLLKFM